MSFLPLLDTASTVRTFVLNPWVNGVILGIMVLGVFLSFRVLNIADLSVEGILPMITMLTAVMIGKDVNPFLVLLISIAIGAVCGMMNALLTMYLKTPPLLSGIIVMALTFGIAIMINQIQAGSVSFDANKHATVFNWLRNLLASTSNDRIFLVYASYLSYILVGIVILLIIWFSLYFFFGTELGMSIRAYGKNESMATANGISPRKASIIALAISGGLIGLASSLYGQHNCMGLPTDGQGMIVTGLSSLFLGEMIFGRVTFKRSMLSALFGSIIYWYIIQVLMLIDTNGYMLSVYKALLLALILAIELGISTYRKKHPKGPKKIKHAGTAGINENNSPMQEMKASLLRHCLGGNYHA